MKKKLATILPMAKSGYDWKYCSIGGVTRVSIETGDDIAHLAELDEKMWTVLSCPVKGLEFPERTLSLMDNDGDGRIRVQEVTSAAQWLCRVLVDADLLRKGAAELPLSDINVEDAEGKELRDMAKHILETLEKTGGMLTIDDLDAYRKVVNERIHADFESRGVAAVEQPYGAHSDVLMAAVDALREKINDYFLRCRLVRYEEGSAAVLDMSVERLGAISQNNLAACGDELATYPLARADKEAVLHLDGLVNPVWQAAVDALRKALADANEERVALTESQWNTLCERLSAYAAAKTEAAAQWQKELDEALAAELAVSTPIEKLLYLYRDFYRLLHNFVIMSDFYSTDHKAIFQAGKLYVDQRCCELCLRVADMSKHADTMAGLSGMYLIYCTCTSKVKNATMDIVAVLTDGDVDDLRVGKNALFYDRDGLDWDATITKIVDNPISIRQAFWSPYRKFGNWVSEKITKSASEKESKQFEEMTSKADTATTNLAVKVEGGEAENKVNDKKAQVFDIAKFAGIFAAIGLALGAIGGVLVSVGGFVGEKWYNIILLIAAVVIIISGPSMFLAWLKLRKRNLGPVLNANGWAINSKIKVNVRFGATLTGLAQYPKLVLDDPFADKKTPAWKKWMWGIIAVLIVVFAILFFTKSLPWQKEVEMPEEEQAVEVVETVEGENQGAADTADPFAENTEVSAAN